MKLPTILAFGLALATSSHCLAQSPATPAQAPASAPAPMPPDIPAWPPSPTSAEAQMLLIQLQVSLQAYQKVLQLLSDTELDETLASINGKISDQQQEALFRRQHHLRERLQRLEQGIKRTALELKVLTTGEPPQK